MRHGDLKVLFAIAIVTGVLYAGVESGQATQFAARAAATASGALAYWDDLDALYYDESSYSAYRESPEPVYEYADDAWDGPFFWPDPESVYIDPYDSYSYYDPYVEIVTEESPWYVETFPGIGRTFTYLVPPIAAVQPIVQPVAPPRPACAIDASPATVAYGGSTVVSWHAQSSARAVLSGVGDVPGTGSRTFSGLTAPQTYALSVSGLGGSYTCSTSVYVQQGSAMPSCQISTNPSAIRAGEAANLAWVSENAESVRLSGVGDVAQSGGRVVAPTQTTTYTLLATARGGRSTTCAATLIVR